MVLVPFGVGLGPAAGRTHQSMAGLSRSHKRDELYRRSYWSLSLQREPYCCQYLLILVGLELPPTLTLRK